MFGVSSNGKDAIGKIVEDAFDRLALQFVGDIPKLRNKKIFLIGTKSKFSLANLFVQAMSNRDPSEIEKDALRSLLDSAHGYVESLKNKTKSNVTERIDGLVKEAKARGQAVNEEDINIAVEDEMRKAKAQFKAIAESESTKLRNVGSMMDISRIAASTGDEDPTVFFVVVRDNKTCNECKRLHLHDNGTPRVWKFSELKQGYHKRGEDNPSAFGLHPHCRCTLTYLSKGFGFKAGKVAYIRHGHDEHAKQRSS